MNPPEPQPARVRPFSPVGWLVATALFLSVAGVYAYFTIFSAPPTPDEGYLMITVQSFIGGHALYDEVFTQYGPFYYAYKWGVHALLSVPLTHDATRMLCMIHWLTAAVVLGAAGGVMTRSILAGLLVFTQAVVHLTALASEPGHPQELVAMLLALGMLFAARETPRFNRWAALAVVAALLVFTKINVGVFFGFALLLVMRLDAQARSVRRWETWILLGVCAALPFMLMRRHLAAEWCRNYSLLMAGAVSAAFLVAANPTGDRTPRPTGYAKIACFFLLPSAICLGVVWLTGTTLNGLIDGLLLTPLKMPGVALLPLPLSNGVVLNAAASLAAALMVRGRAAHPPVRLAVVGLKAAYGIVGALCLVGSAKTQLAWLLPWVWLVLVPTGEKENGTARDHFPRIFLCLVAAWQGLQAYPIAGTQVSTATFLLVVAYTVCLSDALQFMSARDGFKNSFAKLSPPKLRLAQALAVVVLLFVFASVWCPLLQVRDRYASLPPLELRGAQRVHTDPELASLCRTLTDCLATDCDTFITYPGNPSFYFWADKPPPTHCNSTGWGQLSHAQQERILAALRQSPRPMLAVVENALQRWTNDPPPQIAPLTRFVLEECREVKRVGYFVLFVPRKNDITAQSR